MHVQLSGGCHCGNLRLQVELTRIPGEYSPRACDCDFCCKHGAAWLSDPQGSLRISVRDAGQLVGNMSGGEKQCLAIARAIHFGARVLILDEPTAALDARSEHEVFERFTELVQGKMTILISHRFSTVRMADRILVLKGGRIAEQGSHDQLVKDGGHYAEMFELQAAGYR